MAIAYRCPHCRHKFVPTEPPTAVQIACPKCGKRLNRPGRTTSAEDPVLGATFGGWRPQRRLGAGAMGTVYAAVDGGGRRAALKLLSDDAARDAEFVARFRREAALCQKIDHDGVVRVLGVGEEHGQHWLAMELIEGGSLEDLIAKRKRLDWREAAAIGVQLAAALAHAGRLGIIHRDLKPANILITPDGGAKLVDLGFGKQLRSATGSGDDAGLTMAGVAMGSPCYMPPEQVLDAKAVDRRADIYGLGATLYHALTGDTPYTGRSANEVMERVVQEELVPPRRRQPDIPPALDAVVCWAMTKDMRQRPRDADLLHQALQQAIAAPDDLAAIDRLRGVRRSIPWLAIAGAALAIIALIGLWLALR